MMPIANCIITSTCQKRPGVAEDLTAIWARESKVSSEHMTINLVASTEQHGNQYAIMVNLLLPSLWSSCEISSLQLGLANALTRYFDVVASEVFISTSIVNSGLVVEAGNEIKW